MSGGPRASGLQSRTSGGSAFQRMKVGPNPPIKRQSAVLLAMILLLAACGSSRDGATAGRGGRGGAMGPIQVGYVVVQQGSAPIVQNLPGRVTAYQVSDVRPQVN